MSEHEFEALIQDSTMRVERVQVVHASEYRRVTEYAGHLQAELEDMRDYGLRFDLNPTISWRGETPDYQLMSVASAYLAYLKRIDKSIRERADAALSRNQRQGADSPASATTDPSAAQDHAPSRNNAIQTVGALQEATETPGAQSAPATHDEQLTEHVPFNTTTPKGK